MGGTIELALVIDRVPNGLSGYDVKVSVADPTIGRISAVTFPFEFGVNNQDFLSLPGAEVRLAAIDINEDDPGKDQIRPGDVDVMLALITFKGLKQGVTSIEVSDDTALGIQDENSTIMSVTTTNGALTVQ